MKLNQGPLQLPENPLTGLETWLKDAIQAGVPEPTSMTLATATKDGRPSARIVLFKGFGLDGLEFFTNYESRKAKELVDNPYAALVFHWVTLRRQVRVEGPVLKLTPEESDRYFQTRPRGSQIGAWSSPQSQPIASREELVARIRATEDRFKDKSIPCPPFWGGFRMVPERMEFWEEREFRLHERLVYTKSDGLWQTARVAP